MSCRHPTVKDSFSKNVRHFKRGRQETPKANLESPATPFHNNDIHSGNLTIIRLWKPLLFTVGVGIEKYLISNLCIHHAYNFSSVQRVLLGLLFGNTKICVHMLLPC